MIGFFFPIPKQITSGGIFLDLVQIIDLVLFVGFLCIPLVFARISRIQNKQRGLVKVKNQRAICIFVPFFWGGI